MSKADTLIAVLLIPVVIPLALMGLACFAIDDLIQLIKRRFK